MAGSIHSLIDALPEEARAEAVQIADIVAAEQLRAPASLGTPEAIVCLRRALQSALPDRKCAQLLLDHYAQWEAAVVPGSRTAFLDGFHNLAPALADLGAEGMQSVLDNLNREPRTFPCIYAFAMTTKAAIHAVTALAAMHPVAELQRFTGVLTVEKMEESKEAERLPEVLGRVPDALPLANVLIPRDVSAAYGTLGRLAKVRRSPEYIPAFRDLVEAAGLQVCGWCLDKLPAMNPEEGRQAVDNAIAIARQYGSHAAQAHLEGKDRR